MPEARFRRRLKIVVPVLSVAVFSAFVIATWAFYTSFQQACLSRNQTLNVLSDIVDIATAPAPGEQVTHQRAVRVAAFRAAVRARIQEARC